MHHQWVIDEQDGKEADANVVHTSAVRNRIAKGAPTSTKKKQLNPLAKRRHGSVLSLLQSRAPRCESDPDGTPTRNQSDASRSPVSIWIAASAAQDLFELFDLLQSDPGSRGECGGGPCSRVCQTRCHVVWRLPAESRVPCVSGKFPWYLPQLISQSRNRIRSVSAAGSQRSSASSAIQTMTVHDRRAAA